MNSWKLSEILTAARKRKLDETSGAGVAAIKACTARVSFEYHGMSYEAGQEFQCSSDEARELLATQQITLDKGGFTDCAQVRRPGHSGLLAYRPWMWLEQKDHSGEFDDTMVRVKLLKSRMVIPGLYINPESSESEFFLPFGWAQKFICSLEGGEDATDWQATLQICADQT